MGASTAEEYLEEGAGHFMADRFQEAQKAFERAAELVPKDSEIFLWLGLAKGRRAEQFTGIRKIKAFPLARAVKSHFEKAVSLDSSNLAALKALHGFHLEAPGMVGGDLREAERIADRLAALDPGSGHRAWAALHARRGDHDLEGKSLAAARAHAPEDVSHDVAYAEYLARTGDAEDSDALLEEALTREPNNPEVALVAAKTWIQSKRKDLYPRSRELLEMYLAHPNRSRHLETIGQVRKLMKGL